MQYFGTFLLALGLYGISVVMESSITGASSLEKWGEVAATTLGAAVIIAAGVMLLGRRS